MSCRSSPGFGGRSPLSFYPSSTSQDGGAASGDLSGSLLGPKRSRASMMRPMSIGGGVVGGSGGGGGGGGGSGANSPKVKRPMTSAEIMRQQMKVTEQSDHRLRKTLMRTLVGQTGRRAETIILPLELLRQLKPSEFSDAQEYHSWQRRQLKILEAGLLLHPSIPLDRLNSTAVRLREVFRSSELKPIDTSKNSDQMRLLCNGVLNLAWRSANGAPSEVCHWVDGFPINVHLYLALLQSIFDLRDETIVLDEVDELVELMKRTWPTLGLNRMIHNVANDAKRTEREPGYAKVLSTTLASMQTWAEKRLLDYHDNFDRTTVANLDNILALALTTSRIINTVDRYIRSSMRNAFTRNGVDSMVVEVDEEPSEIIVQLAKDTEELALVEKDTFSPALKRWHPVPTALAVGTLHNCFGVILKQYLARVTSLTNELVRVLQSAAKLEKVLVQMVVEDSADCEDGGKGVVREMVPYEVDSVIMTLLKSWMDERMRIGKEFLARAKETESWIPKSKTEPFAQSAVDLMRLAKVTVDEFYEIPVSSREDLVMELADGLETLFQDYTAFVASCGSKQSYIPPLPPLTRCSQGSKFTKLWKKATPCSSSIANRTLNMGNGPIDGHHPRPSTSRGTQRLYIRINTLHFLLSHIHSLEKSLSFFSGRVRPSPSNRRLIPAHRFSLSCSAIQSAILHVSEVAAYRLIFLDSNHSFCDSLYVQDVANSRIRPALRILKQNLTLLVSVLTDRAQPVAVKEVMKASFEAFLMVLLAGGSERAFSISDYEMILEDFKNLKRVFCTTGEGLVAEEVVEQEAEIVEGIVTLMGQPTERLVEEFSIAACESSNMGGLTGNGVKVPMPPTTGRWNRADPNTLLRVLCHRDDEISNSFLKRTFQLARRH
ncbi:Protein unc-13-like protein [Dioscorea alata]|uniref:Protein unc-13-like protein n=1 Tax=Dioscorea alata TaxID=55571 RepID=A0ACB7UQ08_DIOAL|nr:Protein unc-13-like protein [Dioscorea alata]